MKCSDLLITNSIKIMNNSINITIFNIILIVNILFYYFIIVYGFNTSYNYFYNINLCYKN